MLCLCIGSILIVWVLGLYLLDKWIDGKTCPLCKHENYKHATHCWYCETEFRQ